METILFRFHVSFRGCTGAFLGFLGSPEVQFVYLHVSSVRCQCSRVTCFGMGFFVKIAGVERLHLFVGLLYIQYIYISNMHNIIDICLHV